MLAFVCLDNIRLQLWLKMQVCVHLCVFPLTVGASVDFYAQTDATLLAPLQWDEPQEANHGPLLQLMAHGTLRVGVPWEGLSTHTHRMRCQRHRRAVKEAAVGLETRTFVLVTFPAQKMYIQHTQTGHHIFQQVGQHDCRQFEDDATQWVQYTWLAI